MDERAVVTCFLRHGPDVLLLRRSDAVGSYPGKWGAVSGFAEGTPEEAARWEIHEEVGLLGSADAVCSGDPVDVEDGSRGVRWVIHPYLFDCASADVDPNEEVAEYEWVQPPAILDRETVPRLWETYAAVAPTVETVRADGDHGSAYVSLRALEVLRDHAAEADSSDGDYGDLTALARDLKSARPSMGVVANRVNRVLSEADTIPEPILQAAMDGCDRAVRADGEAAANAAEVVGDRVLTFSRSGTVLDALRPADPEAVFVAESRPAREGVDVARELAEADAAPDVSLCVDAAMGHVLAEEAVETVLVGADSVLADGAVVNKVGTRLAALAAHESGADCYAVCSRDKVVPESSVELESGPPNAVNERSAPFEVLNPTFERTPAELFAGIVTENGVLSVDEVESVAARHADLAGWDE